eukprot:363400-Chlamydomonas_euryale.AAC.2
MQAMKTQTTLDYHLFEQPPCTCLHSFEVVACMHSTLATASPRHQSHVCQHIPSSAPPMRMRASRTQGASRPALPVHHCSMRLDP